MCWVQAACIMYGAGAVLGLAWPGSSAPLSSVCLVSSISPVSSIYVCMYLCAVSTCLLHAVSQHRGWLLAGRFLGMKSVMISPECSFVRVHMLDHATTKHGWISKIIKNHQPHVKLTNKIDGRYTPLLIILFTLSFAGREKGLYLIGNCSGL